MPSKLGAAGRKWVRAPREGGPQGWQSLLCAWGEDHPTLWAAQHLHGQVQKALGESSALAKVRPAWPCLEVVVSCSVTPGLLVLVTDVGGGLGGNAQTRLLPALSLALWARLLSGSGTRILLGLLGGPRRVSPQPGGAWRGSLHCTPGLLDLPEACVITAGLAGRPRDQFSDGKAEARVAWGVGSWCAQGTLPDRGRVCCGMQLWLQRPCLGLSEFPWAAQALGRQFHPGEPPSCGSFSLSPRGGEGRPN